MPVPSIVILHLALLMLKCTLGDYYQYTHQTFPHTSTHEIDQLQPILKLGTLNL